MSRTYNNTPEALRWLKRNKKWAWQQLVQETYEDLEFEAYANRFQEEEKRRKAHETWAAEEVEKDKHAERQRKQNQLNRDRKFWAMRRNYKGIYRKAANYLYYKEFNQQLLPTHNMIIKLVNQWRHEDKNDPYYSWLDQLYGN